MGGSQMHTLSSRAFWETVLIVAEYAALVPLLVSGVVAIWRAVGDLVRGEGDSLADVRH